KLLKCEELKKAADSPLRHHHLRTANIPRRGDLYSGRIPILFNQDMTAWRARPEKPYGKFEYYKNGGADEIIFVFKGGGTLETVFGKQRYRAEDYIVVPRGITYRLVPDKVEEEDYLILESTVPVRIPKRYMNGEGQIYMGSPYSERDFHGPSELNTVDKEEDTEILVKDGPRGTCMTKAHHPFDVVGWYGYVYPYTFNAQYFEQKCAEDRGTGGHVRHSAHSRAHRSSRSARRRKISVELARLGNCRSCARTTLKLKPKIGSRLLVNRCRRVRSAA